MLGTITIPYSALPICCFVFLGLIVIFWIVSKVLAFINRNPKSSYVEFPIDEENFPPMRGGRINTISKRILP